MVKFGYERLLTSDLLSGVTDSFSPALSSGTQLGTAILIAKPLVLSLLGKYALYQWLTKGTNAGIKTQTKFGPFSTTYNVGFEAIKEGVAMKIFEGFWGRATDTGSMIF